MNALHVAVPSPRTAGTAQPEGAVTARTRGAPPAGARHRPPAGPSATAGGRSQVEDLVSRAKSGEEEAFARLYRLYSPLVSRYLARRIRDPLAVEDLTSETFLRILCRIGTFSWQGHAFEAWVLTIARNLAIDHARSVVMSRNRLDADARRRRLSPSAEDEALVRIFRDALDVVLEGLTPPQRECVRLRLIADLSVSETARLMGRSAGAVKTLHYRAMKKVCAQIGEDYGVRREAVAALGRR
ncbi:sigma-70 family RNA polymerase sigma factor [Kitasatospora sp. MBT63]|uniref:sigma-70 family RNA polymerase sigma factor n=1 Tax=Kitasatospora sp. MBT63 TaxID=1444768 RepID=UPI00068F23B8|nr:sigma-70 family RNA polymerase sigma factor [Kitasatospora sp. MBT63]